jgi:hypothetical protein
MLTPRLLRRTAIATLLFSLGCATWQPAAESPAVLIRDQEPPRVRLTLDDGSRMIVRTPQLVRDSVHGVPDRCQWVRRADGGQTCESNQAPMVALNRVTLAETQATNAAGTVAVIIALPLVMLFAVALGTGCDGYC